MTTNTAYDAITREMYKKAKELMQMMKEAGLKEGDHRIVIQAKNEYIHVELDAEEGQFEICTLRDEEPKLSFREA